MADKAGFLVFIRSVGIDETVLPDDSVDIDSALALSVAIVYSEIAKVSALIYDQCVYSLGISNLIEFATDKAGKTFFADARKQYNIDGFVAGVIASASDEGTSESLLNPDFLKGLNLSDLQYLKTPWGRQYLSLAQRAGGHWGIS